MKVENPYIRYGSNMGILGDTQADMLADQDSAFFNSGGAPDYSTYVNDAGPATAPSQMPDITPWVTPGNVSTPAPANASSGWNFNAALSTAAQVAADYLKYQTAATQADAAVQVSQARAGSITPTGLTAPYGYTTSINPLTGQPVYSPNLAPAVPGIAGSLTGSSNTLLLIGLAIGALVLLR